MKKQLEFELEGWLAYTVILLAMYGFIDTVHKIILFMR